MNDQTSLLKQIFDLLQGNPWSKARALGKEIEGGKKIVNHYLYGYEGVLFEKKGDFPPQWRVISGDAYSQMVQRLNPTRGKGSGSKPSIPMVQSKLTIKDMSSFTLCESCDTPIKPNGMCRCS